MRNPIFLIIVLFLFGCQNVVKDKNQRNTDTIKQVEVKSISLYDNLEKKFGIPISTEREADIYLIFKWESFETEYGKKFKNEIDKELNVLPFKTETDISEATSKGIIIDVYQWETPRIFVELTHSFQEIGGKIKSKIKVRINNK